MSSSGNFEINHSPQKKRRWDAVLVGTGMIIAFSIIMTRLTGYSPCDLVDALPVTDARCAALVETNWNVFVEWLWKTLQILQMP